MRRLIHAVNIDQALQMSPQDALPAPVPHATVADAPRREAPDASAFWPELTPEHAQQLVDRGYGEEVKLTRQMHAELTAAAMGRGWGVPDALKSRAVFETAKVLTTAKDPKQRLKAVEILERMVRANANPNALPEQLNPGGSGPAAAIQVNIKNEVSVPASAPSATVSELVDEILGRADVQRALDADVPDPGYEYGM